MNTMARCVVGAALGILFLTLGASSARADQPKLGFEGRIVDLPAKYGGAKGYRITQVYRNSHASRARLEPGDTIVYIDNMFFENEAAYDYAMCQVGDTAQIGFINIRNDELTWFRCRFGHRPHGGSPPRGFGVVDWEHRAVITIYNRTSVRLNYQLRTQRNESWSDWVSYEHDHPNNGWRYHYFPGVDAIEIRFDRIGGDDDYTEKIYNLNFNAVTVPRKIGKDDGRGYYFRFDSGGRLLDLHRM